MRKIIVWLPIISGVVLMATPVKSNIGADSIINGEEWQIENPYITDGLVAMWDGLASDGLFVDLVSGEEIELPQYIIYDEETKGFLWTRNQHLIFPLNDSTKEAIKSTDITIEICIAIKPYTLSTYRNILQITGAGSGILIYTPRSATSTQRYIYFNYFGRKNSVDNYVLDEAGNFEGTISLVCDAISMKGSRYINGIAGMSMPYTEKPEDYPTSMQMSLMANAALYSIRIYSRSLNAKEVAHNAEVDKERFNVP